MCYVVKCYMPRLRSDGTIHWEGLCTSILTATTDEEARAELPYFKESYALRKGDIVQYPRVVYLLERTQGRLVPI